MSYESEVLADNPFAYWRLNETSGVVAADEVGYYDGNYSHNPILGVAGPIDLAAEFIFDIDRDLYSSVLLGGLGSLGSNLINTGISIECWIKPVYSNQNIVFVANNGFCLSYIIIQDTTTLEPPGTIGDVLWTICDMNGDNVWGTNYQNAVPVNLYDGNWHHIVLTWDGTTDKTLFYIDGELNKESHEFAAILPTQFVDFVDCEISPVEIGEVNVGYTGGIAEFAIYDNVLSPGRISLHYNEAFPSPTPVPYVPPTTVCHNPGFRCATPSMHQACWKWLNNAWVPAITVCNLRL